MKITTLFLNHNLHSSCWTVRSVILILYEAKSTKEKSPRTKGKLGDSTECLTHSIAPVTTAGLKSGFGKMLSWKAARKIFYAREISNLLKSRHMPQNF